MEEFIQNHPGETEAKPRYNPQDGNTNSAGWAFLVLACVPVIITYAVLSRLKEINKIETWMYYVGLAIALVLGGLIGKIFIQKITRRRINEQKKYYKLTGANWLPQPKREALQLDAPDGYKYGEWIETLEYWPCEIRLPKKVDFKTFIVTTKEERLEGNDQSWGVLSEKSYNETIDRLFNGMHSELFATEKHLMPAEEIKKMITRLADLTQLPESYVQACWETKDDQPPLLLWGFDLQRIIELSRTSFMAGLITEETAWQNILKTSAYIHALFDDMDSFYNNFRLGHAYLINDFKVTSEKLKAHKAYTENCDWPIKEIAWRKNGIDLLPDVIRNGCKAFVDQQILKSKHQVIKGFQSGNTDHTQN
ncbi:hypothetical protein CA265_01170 [Sphingobacteriaceae bacterium GW460-11-11-14-LB5]|nr:hypothetical protein CA265_01170 [Sphingobacteriaceae bacterium GW460-11-11-14-LB5]